MYYKYMDVRCMDVWYVVDIIYLKNAVHSSMICNICEF